MYSDEQMKANKFIMIMVSQKEYMASYVVDFSESIPEHDSGPTYLGLEPGTST
jgi:hypothetical protein